MKKIKKITGILFSEVVSEGGTPLGRVYDLRSAGEPEHGLTNETREISGILYGTRSFLEVLGLKETELKIIDWSSVVGIADRKIIVRETPPRTTER